jgi:hypothetical protein
MKKENEIQLQKKDDLIQEIKKENEDRIREMKNENRI